MKPQILPLGIKNRTKTELPALIALEAIGQPWFNEDHRCDLMSIALVTQLLADKESAVFLASCELIDCLGPDQLDMDQLEPLVMMVNTWVQKQPNSRVELAIDHLLGRTPSKKSKRAHG